MVGSKVIDEGEGKRKKGGRNGFDEHQDIKQNKGMGSPKAQQLRENNTRPPEQSCRQ
jgi:hypothetical protein